MATKSKKRTLPTPASKAEFNSEEMREAAEAEIKRLREHYGEEAGFKALVKFIEWGRDAVGYRSVGRVITTGKAER